MAASPVVSPATHKSNPTRSWLDTAHGRPARRHLAAWTARPCLGRSVRSAGRRCAACAARDRAHPRRSRGAARRRVRPSDRRRLDSRGQGAERSATESGQGDPPHDRRDAQQDRAKQRAETHHGPRHRVLRPDRRPVGSRRPWSLGAGGTRARSQPAPRRDRRPSRHRAPARRHRIRVDCRQVTDSRLDRNDARGCPPPDRVLGRVPALGARTEA